ncbi:Uu.00g023900.m01.CDS01 [Anthostomella pinea]|uniref:Uu.00g023900.m01.CDS01 n=1 Tax=Anthostomella pinea TaxID=933095 RepID=A0AAI8YR57_9PEZI|nr:Uu.00g023900.m01.CDS01 [Anthostomella pinea]
MADLRAPWTFLEQKHTCTQNQLRHLKVPSNSNCTNDVSTTGSNDRNQFFPSCAQHVTILEKRLRQYKKQLYEDAYNGNWVDELCDDVRHILEDRPARDNAHLVSLEWLQYCVLAPLSQKNEAPVDVAAIRRLLKDPHVVSLEIFDRLDRDDTVIEDVYAAVLNAKPKSTAPKPSHSPRTSATNTTAEPTFETLTPPQSSLVPVSKAPEEPQHPLTAMPTKMMRRPPARGIEVHQEKPLAVDALRPGVERNAVLVPASIDLETHFEPYRIRLQLSLSVWLRAVDNPPRIVIIRNENRHAEARHPEFFSMIDDFFGTFTHWVLTSWVGDAVHRGVAANILDYVHGKWPEAMADMQQKDRNVSISSMRRFPDITNAPVDPPWAGLSRIERADRHAGSERARRGAARNADQPLRKVTGNVTGNDWVIDIPDRW